MANFNVHLTGAAVISGMAASALAYSGLYSLNECMLLWAAGTLGGLLPDIDSDSAAALSWIFSILGFMASLLVFRIFPGQSLMVTWGMMLGLFVAVRFGIMGLFMRFTRHRGAYHSLLAGVFTALLVSYLSWHGLGLSRELSWGLGGLVFVGFVTHLVLDECYAVDLTGMEIKSSFGTALKPFSLNAWWASLFLGVASVMLWWQLPSPEPLVDAVARIVFSQSTWHLSWMTAR